MLTIFYFKLILMETNQINFFGTSNGNMAYNFICFFTGNVLFKKHVVKNFSSYLGINFKPVFFKDKIFLWSL